MEVAYQLNRRKACDLCFLKKIKCDMLKPACSNCQLYKAECHTTRVRKRLSSITPRQRQRSEPPQATNSQDNRIDSVESRLTRIEERLNQVLAAAATPVTGNQQRAVPSTLIAPLPSMPDQCLANVNFTELDDFNQIFSQTCPSTAKPDDLPTTQPTGLGVDRTDAVVSSSYPPLPPLHEIQPAIEYYFTHVNSLIPLFSETAFLRMLHSYYASSCQYPRPVWAAVNVVLALVTRLPPLPSSNLDLGSGDNQVAKFVNNAQSVLPELVAQDVHLLGLQVLLGLVIIFNSLKDPQPAVVLVGTAVRLAHRLRLHSRDYQQRLSPDEVLQRNRVFWIAYLFDKDISLRHHTPSVQADADIDLDLPAEKPPDGAGNIYDKDGHAIANFFHLRLRLAHIQGRVYNLLFATRASKITPQERRARVTLLHNQLERWRLTVPPELQAGIVMEHAGRAALFWLCMMHFSYLGCLVMIHGIWSHDAEWRKRLTTTFPASDAVDRSHHTPPLPRNWRICVDMSRHCMRLMYRMPLSDCSVWANGCAYFSAMIILQANIIEYPMHEEVDADLQLTGYAVDLNKRMSEASTIVQMKRMDVVCAELDRRARLAVDNARRIATSGGSPSRAGKGYTLAVNHDSTAELQWDWGNDGVEAWPSMDASLNEAYTTILMRNEPPEADFGPFDEWTDIYMGDSSFDNLVAFD